MNTKYTGQEWHKFCDAIREHERAMRKIAAKRDELAKQVRAEVRRALEVRK